MRLFIVVILFSAVLLGNGCQDSGKTESEKYIQVDTVKYNYSEFIRYYTDRNRQGAQLGYQIATGKKYLSIVRLYSIKNDTLWVYQRELSGSFDDYSRFEADRTLPRIFHLGPGEFNQVKSSLLKNFPRLAEKITN